MAKTWNSGEPSQEWLAKQNYPKSTATTHPRGHKTTSKELQASLVPRQKSLLSKKNIKACLSFVRKHLDDPQDFWENTL